MERLGLHAVLPLPRPSVSLCRDAVLPLPLRCLSCRRQLHVLHRFHRREDRAAVGAED